MSEEHAEVNDHEKQSKRTKLGNEGIEAMKSLHADLQKSIDQILASKSYPEEIMTICSELWEEISFLKLECSANSKLLVEQEDKMRQQGDLIAQLQAENQCLKSEGEAMAKMKEKNEELEAKCQQIQNEMLSVEEALLDDLARINAENEDLQNKLSEANRLIGQKSCPQCALIADQIDSFCLSLKELEEQLASAPKQIDLDNLEIDYQKKIDVLVVDKSQLEEQAASLKADLQAREEDVLGLMEKIAVLKRNERGVEEKFEAEIHTLQSAIGSLHSQKDLTDKELTALKQDCESVRLECDSLKTENISLVSQLSQLNNQLSELSSAKMAQEQQIAESEQISCALKDQNAALQADLASSVSQTKALQSEVQGLSSEADSTKAKFASLQLVVKDLEDKLIEEKIVTRDLRAEVEQLRQQSDGQTARLPEYVSRIQELERSCRDKDELLKKLEQDMTLKEMDGQKLTEFWKDQLSSLQEDHRAEMTQIQADLARLRSESARTEMLETQNNILKADMENLKAAKASIDQMLERSRSQKQELTDKVDQLEMLLAKKDDEMRSKQASGSESKSNEVLLRIELEKTRETFNKEKRMLQLRISELEDEVESSSGNNEVDLFAKLKRVEEENFRINQLHQANLHKLEYYASIINKRDKENRA